MTSHHARESGPRRFKPYPQYKDSGVEWLGGIPAHWDHLKIKHSTYVKGRIGWQNLRVEEFTDEGPYCVTGTDFEKGRVEWSRCYRVTEERYALDPYIHLHDGDLLITKDGSIGKLALVDALPGPACLNSGIFVTRRATDKYTSEYLYWVLSSSVFANFIEYMSAGTTIQHLYQYVFETFQFPSPNRDEQRAIAGFLDRETAKIDALVAKKERLIELLQEKRTALITRAVTKGLDPNVPMKDSGVEWLGQIPALWEVKRIKNLSRFVTSGSRGWADYYSDDGPFFLRIGNLRSGAIELDLNDVQHVRPPEGAEGERTQVRPGDLVISITALIGAVGVVPEGVRDAFVNQHLALVRLSAGHVDPRWLAYCVLSRVGQEQFAVRLYGGTKDGLGLEDIRSLIVLLPP